MNQELLNRLQKKISKMPFNSLKRIYPEKLREWLEVSGSDWLDFIKYLVETRLIICKYDFDCSCGNYCSVYWNKISVKNFQCPLCGKTFTDKEVENNGTLVYEINKADFLEYGQDEIDYKKIVRDSRKVLPFKKENEKMEIFIGSSSEAAEYMEEIAFRLQKLSPDNITLMWNETGKGIFPPGSNTIDSLIQITKRVQAAVFIFNADDTIWNNKSALEGNNSVRDNVLFEYGLFVGALGKEKVCFVCKGHPKIASDLKGITYIDGDLTGYEVKGKLKDWIEAM